MHKYCILSIQQCGMLLYTLNLGYFTLGFAIYPVKQCNYLYNDDIMFVINPLYTY